nr:transposase [Candidatus Enterovibrio escacola]
MTKRDKWTMGGFYTFELHLIINEQDGIFTVRITTSKVDDRKPVPDIVDNLWGSLHQDKGIYQAPLEIHSPRNGLVSLGIHGST